MSDYHIPKAALPSLPKAPLPAAPKVKTNHVGETADGAQVHEFERLWVRGEAFEFQVERHWIDVSEGDAKEYEVGLGGFVAIKGFGFEKSAPSAAEAHDILFGGPQGFEEVSRRPLVHPDGTPCFEVMSTHRDEPLKRRLVFVQGQRVLVVISALERPGANATMKREVDELVSSIYMRQ
jgi:hypothetical protein